ncbi:uncharacterized protein PHALS_12488 [Plasmopara halstedii]|uniref:Uncharacterized protein n=1 Tax=Plasmopara halstedii TaxID=4781 RepID=A0A0P1AM22_PLAHL|nr:uncharacterized protein PHALS_12488 [Plasmopara halstedii]CEG42194.1 hypothetical protein PHALS_12488 [Plasmopara halstedii]|eukprot:XP_024578563.1 hypothetical protein PHALS_12488 [Plasmopara halstedii]
MSSLLFESDDEGFIEVLALLNEYNVAIQESNGRFKCTSPLTSLIESSTWSAFETAHPIPKTTSKHRNGAREMRRRELQFLRTCVKGLEAQLYALKEVAEQRAQSKDGTANTSTQTSALRSIWKDLAARQLDQRLTSERENSRLKSVIEDQNKVQEMLQRVLNTRVARRVLETTSLQEKKTRRVYGIPLEMAYQLFDELEVGVDLVFHEAAKVFFQADTGTGRNVGIFGDKILPFSSDLTAETAWRCLAHAYHHEKNHCSYSREMKRAELESVTHVDTVRESFGVETQTPEHMAEFEIRQVFCRYHEANRTVIAWKSFIDPSVFQGRQLEGFRFQEKGSCVICREPKFLNGTCSNEFTLLRIWHVITPETLAYTTGISSKYVQELTEFVLGGSSSASTMQMIENMLIEQSK